MRIPSFATKQLSTNNSNYLPPPVPPPPVNLFHSIRECLSRLSPRRRGGTGTRAERGRFGENRAAEFVRKRLGYRVIARNWCCERDEIDLICRDGEVLVFIEVRLRSARARVPAYYSVGRKKKAILRRVCRHYLQRLQNPPKHFRFDVIALALSDDGRYELMHYPNVPLFPKHYTAQR